MPFSYHGANSLRLIKGDEEGHSTNRIEGEIYSRFNKMSILDGELLISISSCVGVSIDVSATV
jgi:hypothetical protein